MRLRSLLLPLVVLVGGCGASESSAPTQVQVAAAKPWDELKTKLDKMSPTERAQYIQAHPDEVAQLGRQ